VAFQSQGQTSQVWSDSGAQYILQVIPRADHAVQSLDAAIREQEGIGLAQKVLLFFGLPLSQ
jgi:hypothetical protein